MGSTDLFRELMLPQKRLRKSFESPTLRSFKISQKSLEPCPYPLQSKGDRNDESDHNYQNSVSHHFEIHARHQHEAGYDSKKRDNGEFAYVQRDFKLTKFVVTLIAYADYGKIDYYEGEEYQEIRYIGDYFYFTETEEDYREGHC